MSIKSKIQALIAAANTATGGSDATLTDAVQTLVDGYGQGGGEWTTDGIADCSEPSGDLVITASKIEQFAFRMRRNIHSIRSTTVTAIYGSACYDCDGLLTVFLPKVTTARGSIISNCSALKTAVIGTIGGDTDTFRLDPALEIVDLSTGNIGGGAFNSCSSLSKLILRSSAIQRLNNTNAFTTNTPFNSGGTGGTIYIPKALYDHLGDGSSLDYKAATNWSTIDGYGTITWAQIEGSQYEHFYADGTPIE